LFSNNKQKEKQIFVHRNQKRNLLIESNILAASQNIVKAVPKEKTF